MEIQNSNTYAVNQIQVPGNPAKNKHAVISFVFSLISIVFSPVILFQIVGIVLGIMGIKSQKKGLSIAGIVINSIMLIVGIFAIFVILSLVAFGGVVANAQLKADQVSAQEISSAIVSYIEDSDDIELKYGEEKTVDVQTLINRLQIPVFSNGKVYGPYLTSGMSEAQWQKPASSASKGWEIIVDKAKGVVEVNPSSKGDSLIIK